MNFKDKLLQEALKPNPKFVEKGRMPSIAEDTITSKDDDIMKGIISDEFRRRGIEPEELSIISTASIVSQGLISLLERVAEIQSVQKRESSILTAQKNVTLYNQLIQHTDDVELSRPSRLELFVVLPFVDIEKYGEKQGSGRYRFKYTTDNTILLDNKQFIPMYDFELLLTKTSNKQEIKVQYQTIEGFKSVPSQRVLDNNGYYFVIFKAPFTQITVVKQERTFTGNPIEKFIIKTDHPIHDFFLTYKDGSMDRPRPIDKKLYFTRGTEEYIKYTLHSNTKMSLNHVYQTTGFKPKAGGKLSIHLLTTTGEDIRYRGDAIIQNRYPSNLNVDYSPVSTEYVSSGGKLASDSKEYLRSYIIKLKGTRLRMDTEDDLATYLNTYPGNSLFQPRLVISDLKRVFNIYSLMSFENNGNIFTVPTTSGDVSIPLNKLDKVLIDGRPMYSLKDISIESIQKIGSSTFYLKPDTPTTPNPGESLFQYGIPFHLSYDEANNYIRVLSESQHNVPYDSFCIYDSDSVHIPTRFVNTTIRVDDYENSDRKRVFALSTEIRSDNTEFKLVHNETFSSYIHGLSKDGREIRIPCTELIDQKKDSKYTLVFNLDSDRKVYNRFFHLTCQVLNKETNTWVSEKVLVDINQSELILELSVKVPEVADWLVVTKYTSNVEIFKDVSRFMYLQSIVTLSGNLKILLTPMVEKDFMDDWRNRSNINSELMSIFSFIDSDVYSNNEYSSKGYSLKDRQETLFTTSIKFSKTHGRSKFLCVGDNRNITNLQVSPTFKVRLSNEQYDINKISSDANQFLTRHNFLSSDLHMNALVKEVLNNNSANISMLQFVTFGETYNDTDHMLYHNGLTFANDDVPESISLRPVYDETLGVYVYSALYEKI